MKKIMIAGLVLALSLVSAMAVSAYTISIPGGVSGMPYYGGEYTGPIAANLDGKTIAGGITCVDFKSMTYVPNPGFGVTLESLTPSSLTGARFATDINALLKYQEAAWLNTQIHLTADKTTIGEIQFAIWTLFTPSAINQTGINVASVNNWLGQAALINPSLFDFSSIRIYTPTGPYASNQEFISGDVAPVPEPGTMALLGFGMFGLAIFGKRRMNKES